MEEWVWLQVADIQEQLPLRWLPDHQVTMHSQQAMVHSQQVTVHSQRVMLNSQAWVITGLQDLQVRFRHHYNNLQVAYRHYNSQQVLIHRLRPCRQFHHQPTVLQREPVLLLRLVISYTDRFVVLSCDLLYT